MYEPPPASEIVLKTKQRPECLESCLVLDAAGISAEAISRDGWWLLVVDRNDLAVSVAELNAYRLENPVRSTGGSAAIPIHGGAAMAVFVYAGLIVLIAILDARSVFGRQWLPAGCMQAGKVLAGEWWRTVTALTLHLDALHIASNIVFGALFGFLGAQALGGGVAWLTIVVAGALGNFVNALVQAPTHSSIGASTAVFAALGVIVSHALQSKTSAKEKPLNRWSPLIGGVLLRAFTGVGGERMDVVAHLSGFLAGLLLGWLGCGLPNHWLASRSLQFGAGLTAIALVAAAWIVALVIEG